MSLLHYSNNFQLEGIKIVWRQVWQWSQLIVICWRQHTI